MLFAFVRCLRLADGSARQDEYDNAETAATDRPGRADPELRTRNAESAVSRWRSFPATARTRDGMLPFHGLLVLEWPASAAPQTVGVVCPGVPRRRGGLATTAGSSP